MAKIAAKGLSINFQTDSFTGDGTNVALLLTALPYGTGAVLVFIDGLFYPPANWTLSGSTLTLDAAPAASSDILVWYLRSK